MRHRTIGAPPRVLTFGEALVGYETSDGSLRTAERFTRFPGGADLNVAVGLGRLGVAATWASVLARDAHGDYLNDAVTALGVDAVTVRADGSTALMFKASGAPGDPEVLQVRGGTAFARHAELLMPHLLSLDGIDHVHLTGIVLAISPGTRAVAYALLEAAVAAGVTVSFDPNLRLNLWPDPAEMRRVVNAVAARCTIVLPGRGEAQLLTGVDDPRAIADFYLAAGAHEVAVKLGAAGAVAYTAELSARSRPFTVSPVDTVGAGDGFAAGYIAAKLSGGGLQERLDQAAAVGAFVTTRAGDLAAMPNRQELDVFLAADRMPQKPR
ncbi:sugar kinase [Microbacterium lacus]|uniref:sugar kinase n=1 Tax=Microbacterium lacus TaxID=415217 RepID=UPI00384F8782